MTDSLDTLREKIDDITLQMIHLLKRRSDITGQIGDIKRQRGLSISNGTREFALRQLILDEAKSINLSQDIAARFLNHLISEAVYMESSPTPTHLLIFKKAKELEQNGRDIIHMEVGEPDFAPPPIAGDALVEGFKEGHTRYGLPTGMPALRQAIAYHTSQRYDTSIQSDEVIITPGARFAVFAAINALLQPGDEIIIPEPTWPAYKEAAIHCGAKPHIIHTTLEDRWELDIQDIKKITTPQTKMIVLCYPSNPTGKVLSPSVINQIVQHARENDMYILSDEIYSEYSSIPSKSILEYGYKKSIVTQSFSKSHAMMGFRIGYGVAHPDIIHSMSRIAALCLTNVPDFIQYAALKSLNYDTAHNVQTIQRRLDTMCKMASEVNLEFMRPDGAMYIFGRADGIQGIDLVERCLDRGLALAPGVGFGHYPEFVRISAGTDRVTDGMNILCDVLKEDRWRR